MRCHQVTVHVAPYIDGFPEAQPLLCYSQTSQTFQFEESVRLSRTPRPSQTLKSTNNSLNSGFLSTSSSSLLLLYVLMGQA